MVAILKNHLVSARTGDCTLYLRSLQQMLPYLAASGHNNYVKSITLFLEKMSKLSTTHPFVSAKFQEGFFVVRRSEKFWAGIFPDLCIEQALMGGAKGVGGLSRVRGFDEVVRLVWLLSTPVCAAVVQCLYNLVGLRVNAQDTHQDLSNASITRDAKDAQTVMDYFLERQPFSCESKELRSLSTGIRAENSVNVDEATDVGERILNDMEGKSVKDYVFKRNAQVKNLVCQVPAAVYYLILC